MGSYIKLLNNTDIQLAGQVANDDMLSEGYFWYEGEIPTESDPRFIRWNANTSSLFVDTDYKRETQLITVREKRNTLLSECDWVTVKYTDLKQDIPQEWVDYRQSLRNITDNFTTLEELVWPEKPTNSNFI